MWQMLNRIHNSLPDYNIHNYSLQCCHGVKSKKEVCPFTSARNGPVRPLWPHGDADNVAACSESPESVCPLSSGWIHACPPPRQKTVLQVQKRKRKTNQCLCMDASQAFPDSSGEFPWKQQQRNNSVNFINWGNACRFSHPQLLRGVWPAAYLLYPWFPGPWRAAATCVNDY